MKTLVVFGALLVAAPARAQDSADARVVLARGDVSVRGAAVAVVATPGMVIHQGDQVRTGHDGTVRLLIAGAAVVDLSPDTSMVVQHAQASQTRLKMWSGYRLSGPAYPRSSATTRNSRSKAQTPWQACAAPSSSWTLHRTARLGTTCSRRRRRRQCPRWRTTNLARNRRPTFGSRHAFTLVPSTTS